MKTVLTIAAGSRSRGAGILTSSNPRTERRSNAVNTAMALPAWKGTGVAGTLEQGFTFAEKQRKCTGISGPGNRRTAMPEGLAS